MVENKDANRSLLLPKWQSISNIGNKDYSTERPSVRSIDPKVLQSFRDDYNAFKLNPSITAACYLLNASIILRRQDVAQEISHYLDNSSITTFSLSSLVDTVKERKNKVDNEDNIQRKINKLRSVLVNQNRNALLWLELGRQYSAIGLNSKAKRCVEVAVNIAPINRFVVRSAARFFIHIDDSEIAYKISSNAFSATADPLIRSTLINCAILNEVTLKKINIIKPEDVNTDNIFLNSELLSSSAMVDIRIGNEKRAKKLLKIAWKDPTESVLANAEWIIRNKFQFLKDEQNLDFYKSAEASTWEDYFALDFESAISNSVLWGFEEPYSTHPFSCGSGIACLAGKYQDAAKIAKEGLIANPNDILLKNNYIFSCLRNNNIADAEKVFSTISQSVLDDDIFYLTATVGLFNYKKGRIEEGRKYYLKAFDLSKKDGNYNNQIKVLLNFAISEEKNVKKSEESIYKRAMFESQNCTDLDIKLLRADLIKIVEEKQKNKINNINKY